MFVLGVFVFWYISERLVSLKSCDISSSLKSSSKPVEGPLPIPRELSWKSCNTILYRALIFVFLIFVYRWYIWQWCYRISAIARIFNLLQVVFWYQSLDFTQYTGRLKDRKVWKKFPVGFSMTSAYILSTDSKTVPS